MIIEKAYSESQSKPASKTSKDMEEPCLPSDLADIYQRIVGKSKVC